MKQGPSRPHTVPLFVRDFLRAAFHHDQRMHDIIVSSFVDTGKLPVICMRGEQTFHVRMMFRSYITQTVTNRDVCNRAAAYF